MTSETSAQTPEQRLNALLEVQSLVAARLKLTLTYIEVWGVERTINKESASTNAAGAIEQVLKDIQQDLKKVLG